MKVTAFAVLNSSDWNFEFNDTTGSGKFLLSFPSISCFWEMGIGTKGPFDDQVLWPWCCEAQLATWQSKKVVKRRRQ